MQRKLSFPSGFLWGAATAAYQIEGGLTNDWSEWEKSPRRLAYLKKHGFNDPLPFQSGAAADSWHRFEDDIACLKKIKATAYRFSVDWSRLEPVEGQFNEEALNRYHGFIKRLKEENIEPFVTLWHWPLPLWLRDRGGWLNHTTVNSFAKLVERCVRQWPEVKFWITLNEPEGYAGNSYLIGIWPPQIFNLFSYSKVIKNLIAAHSQAYDVIKNILPDAQISVATPRAFFQSASDPISRLFKRFAQWWWNDRFFSSIATKLDFIGLNYYWQIDVHFLRFTKMTGPKISEMGWTINPEGLYDCLMDLKKYKLPVYITENGLADKDDKLRPWFIQTMLTQAARAISEGVDLRGYFYWSLLDNFEWAHGYDKKFGLFSFDQKTFARTARPSAEVYAKIAEENAVPETL